MKSNTQIFPKKRCGMYPSTVPSLCLRKATARLEFRSAYLSPTAVLNPPTALGFLILTLIRNSRSDWSSWNTVRPVARAASSTRSNGGRCF